MTIFLTRSVTLIFSMLLMACTPLPSVDERVNIARKTAKKVGWLEAEIVTDSFNLRSYYPAKRVSTETLTIYIEGDGLAWISSTRPSFDPTPTQPLALKLALRDTDISAYLARPCQYVGAAGQPACVQKYWTSHRFSEEVIRASDQAIDQLKQQFKAKRLILVGYSGGGAVAALVAARRRDVVYLNTIAGNLDHLAWTSMHHMSPLSGSLNPADAWVSLQQIPQVHYVGGSDHNITQFVTKSYAARFPADVKPKIIVIPGFDHYCCWQEKWPILKWVNH